MAVYDRWHKTYPKPDHPDPDKRDHPCKCARGKNKLYPTKDHPGQKDKNGKPKNELPRWQVRWYDEDGNQLKRNFCKKGGGKDETDPEVYAEAFDHKIQNDMNAGRYISPQKGRVKLKDYAAEWRATRVHVDTTEERVERMYRIHIDPILGELPLGKVKPSNIHAWIKNRTQEMAPSSLIVTYSALSAMFNSAALDGDIYRSPCVGIRVARPENTPHFIPLPDQVHGLGEKLPRRYSAIPYVAAGTGLRGGEIFGLELDAIDFLRREIDVVQQLKTVGGRKPYLAKPKTRTSVRTVEMSQVTANALAMHIEEFPPVEVEIIDETDPRKPRKRLAKLVFVWAGANGTPPPGKELAPIHRTAWGRAWIPAAQAVGFPPRVGLHALRHYFATLLIHHGASVKTVQLALGHSNPMITLNTYVGVWPEAHEKTRTIVDAALGSVPRMCPPALAAAHSSR